MTQFYAGWKYLLDNSVATSLMQNFCVYENDEEGSESVVPLKDRGFETMVTSDNREEYVFLLYLWGDEVSSTTASKASKSASKVSSTDSTKSSLRNCWPSSTLTNWTCS